MNNNAWITWEHQERNIGLSKAYGCDLFVIDFDKHNKIVRLLFCIFSTSKILITNKFEKIFAQSPSLILAAFLACLRKLSILKTPVILDLHNSSIEALNSKNYIKKLLATFSAKNADYLVITNNGLRKELEKHNSNLLILPDTLPDFNKNCETHIETQQNNKTNIKILVIASYASDEPLNEILTAISQIAISLTDQSIKAYVTGKKTKAGSLLSFESETITFTDYLPKESYHELLFSSDLVIDLTTRDNCLVCGAYEAIAAEVPAILSDSIANREIFKKGMIFTKNDTNSINLALSEYTERRGELKKEIIDFKKEFEQSWSLLFSETQNEIR